MPTTRRARKPSADDGAFQTPNNHKQPPRSATADVAALDTELERRKVHEERLDGGGDVAGEPGVDAGRRDDAEDHGKQALVHMTWSALALVASCFRL